MRILFISDIHGIITNLEHIKKRFIELNCSKLIILGDLFNGNPNYNGYDVIKVQKFLNDMSDKIICMRGNCDTDFCISKCLFKVNDELLKIQVDGYDFYLNHGQDYNYNNVGYIEKGVLIYGHEHKPYIRKKNQILCINPGSISLSRSDFTESYLIYDNGCFIIYDINDNIIDKFCLDC